MIQIKELTRDETALQDSPAGNRLFDHLRDLVLNLDVSSLESAEGQKEFAIHFARAIESTLQATEVTFHQCQGYTPSEATGDKEPSADSCWSIYGVGKAGSSVKSFQSDELASLRDESFTKNRALIRALDETRESRFFVVPFCGLDIFCGVFVCEIDAAADRENLRWIARDIKSIKKILDIKVGDERQRFLNQQLSALIELTQKIESAGSIQSTSLVISHEFQQYFTADFAAFALVRGTRVCHLSFSGNVAVSKPGLRKSVQQLVLESAIRGRSISDSGEEGSLKSIQLQTCRNESGAEWIHCQPVFDDQGQVIAALVLGLDAAKFQSSKVQSTLTAFFSRMQHSIQLAVKSKSNFFSRLIGDAWSFLFNRKTVVAIFLVSLFCTAMMVSMPYKVRCTGELTGKDRRYVVAPLDGLLAADVVQVGEQIEKGDTLARIDDSDLQIELSAKQSEKSKALRERDVFLAAENIPEVVRVNLMIKKLDSEIKLIKRKIMSACLVATSSGIVISVDEKLGENSPVRKGDQLIEIVPLSVLQLEIHVPADEISKVRIGQNVKCVSSGNLFEPLSGEVESIEPQSKLVDGKNVFVAVLTVDNVHHELKPGMDFFVTIECEQATLGWSLFHKPIQWIDAKFGW